MKFANPLATSTLIVILVASAFSFSFLVPSVAAANPTAHAPIYINGNSQFTAANGIVSGNGTSGNPYIIANWLINASTSDGIKITNTNAFFVITNCYLYNGSLASHFGINLQNATNGLLSNCSCSSDLDGIYLSSSSYDTITNNTCSNNAYEGIFLYSSNNNIIANNSCSNSSNYGIYVVSCSYNTVTSNTISGSNWGIYLYLSSYNTVTGNTCSKNVYGIYLLSSSYNNTITNNTCFSNNYGISTYSSSNNTLTSNNCSSNSLDGISLIFASTNNTVTANTCANNAYENIVLDTSTTDHTYTSSFNTITGNTCYNGYEGIFLFSSDNDTITNNIIYNFNHGIVLRATCNNSTITNNTIYNNGYGIYVYNSSFSNTLANNTCYNNSDGIYVYSNSNYNTLINNNCSKNSIGIYLLSSSYNNILADTCSNNIYGIYLSGSTNSIIQQNEIFNNSYGIYSISIGTEVNYCNIYNNVNYGVYNGNNVSQYVINATYCWWDSPTGPSGIGPGSGDAVSTNVLYNPWLTSPYGPNSTTTDTSTTDFGANFHIMALNGETISTNNSTFSSSISPTVTFNTTAQYCNATFYIDKNSVAGWSTLEITVPDDYMGLDVYAYGGGAWNLMTGNGNYSLSVPYATGSSTPAYDWGTNGATQGSGTDGIQKRVQLMVNLKANQNTKLQIQVYYATSPAVGFDGVNDYAQFPNSAALQIVGNFQLQVVMKVLSQSSGGVLNKRYANEYAISLSAGGYGNFYWGNGGGYTGKGNPDNYIRYVGVVTNWTWERNIANLYGWSYLNGVLGGNYSYAQNVASSTSPVQIGLYSGAYLKAEVYNLSLYNTLNTSGLVLFVNPSSFSGGSNTVVNDFSSNAAIGTAYGNVQYKVWTNYGFQFTLLDT